MASQSTASEDEINASISIPWETAFQVPSNNLQAADRSRATQLENLGNPTQICRPEVGEHSLLSTDSGTLIALYFIFSQSELSSA